MWLGIINGTGFRAVQCPVGEQVVELRLGKKGMWAAVVLID